MLSADFLKLIETMQRNYSPKQHGDWIEIFENDTEVLRISATWQDVCLEENSAYWVDGKFVDKTSGLWVDIFAYHPVNENRLIRKFPLQGELKYFSRDISLPLNPIKFEQQSTFAPNNIKNYLKLLYGLNLNSPDHEYSNGQWAPISLRKTE